MGLCVPSDAGIAKFLFTELEVDVIKNTRLAYLVWPQYSETCRKE
jgi:hypothetical protein